MSTTFLAQAAATFAMTVVIWFVQLVHYPLFALASREHFAEFTEAHGARISWIVMPLMLVELATAVAWLVRPDTLPRGWAVTGLLLLVVIWISTFAVQVPLHNQLRQGFDIATISSLVTTNWIRTVGWTLRLVLLVAAWQRVKPGS